LESNRNNQLHPRENDNLHKLCTCSLDLGWQCTRRHKSVALPKLESHSNLCPSRYIWTHRVPPPLELHRSTPCWYRNNYHDQIFELSKPPHSPMNPGCPCPTDQGPNRETDHHIYRYQLLAACQLAKRKRVVRAALLSDATA